MGWLAVAGQRSGLVLSFIERPRQSAAAIYGKEVFYG